MRKAHDEIDTFLLDFGEMTKIKILLKKLIYSLNFAIHNTHRLVKAMY